ncbi:hypothetical protein AURANDRAFT_68928, partial [Aureococcus anophagefferens]
FLAPEVPGKSSKNVAIHGSAGEPLRLARGGWITLLLNNASHAVVRHVDVAAARDGVNVISSRHVKLDRLHVRGGSDDAIALKSDWALRRVLPMYDVQVTNSVVRSEKCNGLQIGSETVGNISDILFHNVTVLGAAKAAMSIVTMDGSHISRVRYERIRAQNVQALAFIVVGARLRRPGIGDAQVVMDEWIGTISDVSINNVLAHNLELYVGSDLAVDAFMGHLELATSAPSSLYANCFRRLGPAFEVLGAARSARSKALWEGEDSPNRRARTAGSAARRATAVEEGRSGGIRKYATPAEAAAANRATSAAKNARVKSDGRACYLPGGCDGSSGGCEMFGCEIPEGYNCRPALVEMLTHCATCRRRAKVILGAPDPRSPDLIPAAEKSPGPWFFTALSLAKAANVCPVMGQYNESRYKSAATLAREKRRLEGK